ncbi:hypothetical protein Moror_9274 [Moniliophthora roreri MCA 2997]|uniref:Uncharacterized protein n=2 Tax=Moniliophthora roreri TaxID=221103 RepID=V2WXA0_MONRO|nr:hypothetical protein Moror_9274 [Moniliophthora roreri MCA 2997]
MGGFALYDGDIFCGYLWNNEDEIHLGGIEKWEHEHEGGVKEYIEQIRTHTQKVQGHFSQENAPLSNAADTNQPQESIGLLERSDLKPAYLLEHLIKNSYITITEDEIKDRSHADFVAKSIALIQTTWFILQVAIRTAEGLAITELEIITVGFALLNFGTYFLWWNKPLHLKEHNGGCMKAVQEGFTKTLDYICFYSFADTGPLAIQLIFLPLWMTWNIICQCQGLFDDDLAPQELSTRLKLDPLQLYITVYSIAAAFGAIYCIPWTFQFPTQTEQLLWQICAVAVAAAPVAMGCVHWWQKELCHSTSTWLVWLIVITATLLGIFYLFSQVTLIVLALMALQDLSPSGYQTVQWTTFVPHIG